MVLMIVCLNVANLLVARGAARSHEISLRTSIGASPRRIVRQLLTESAVLASIGGTLGVVIAYWGRDVFRWILPGTVNVDLDLRIDWRVLGFALVVSLATGLLFGLLPAIRARRSEAGPSLKEPGTCGTPSRRRLAQVLVSAQVAVSVTLVMGAIFFVRTLWNLSDMELGFDADNLLLFRADLGMLGYDPERSLQLYDEMVREIDALPGVVAVTTSSLPLVSSSQRSVGVELPGAAGTSDSRSVLWVTVRDNYFETIGAPVLRGRDFEPGDDEDAPRVALMNETLAGQLFPDGNAVAQRIGFRGQEVEIAGVVADVQGTRGREARGFIYTNERQFDEGARTFQIRTAVEPTSVTASLRDVARRIDPNLALFDITTQEQQTQGAFVVERLIATSSGFFGGIALLLAAIGLYGVLSFSVTQKTRELGVRMALGAGTPRVVASVIREAVWPVALGIPAGLMGGLAFGQVAETLLYGLTPVDPVTIAVAVSLIVATAALGAYLPARRAANVDPLVALRHE
jgi:predicted permease